VPGQPTATGKSRFPSRLPRYSAAARPAQNAGTRQRRSEETS
jgi:hypothetical protein